MTLKMAEDQGINPTNNTDSPNSIPAETKSSKADAKRRQKQEKKKSKNVYVCEVCLLDGTELSIEVEKNSHGEVLFSKVVENLDIVDKEYFGLRFVQDNSPTKCWLQHRKPIKKQLKIGELKFQFAVKFYEPEPGKHLDEYTRYLLYLQLREDIVYGRLHCPTRTYVLLGSFTAQAEFGDYDFNEHGSDYLDGYQLGPAEVEKEEGFIKRVMDLHKEHRGENPAEAELNFLEVAKRTPRYGVDIHYARNKKGVPIEVGISHKGVIVYLNGEPTDSYGWRAVDLVAYKRKKFMLKLFSSEKRKNPRFSMHKRRDAKNIYISAIEHHSFFRLTNADPSKRAADSLMIGSKFRYSERTLYQIRSDPSFHERNAVGKFSRAPSKRPRIKSEKNRLVRAPVVAEKEKPDVKDKEPEEDFEEIEIDETQPDHNKFDPNEWVIVEKVLPDGTTKRYRRRVTTTTSTTTTTKTTYVIRKGTEEEEHVMEEKPIESPRKEETVVITRKESPEISEKEVKQEVKFEDDSNQQIVTTVITKETIVTEDKREQKLDEEAEPKPMSLADIRASAKKPSAAVKPLMREDIENEAEPTAPTKVLVYNVDKQETVKIVTKEEREAELRRREIEEEQQRQEEIRARNEREAALRRKWKEEEQKRKEEEALEKRQKEMEAEEEAQKNRALVRSCKRFRYPLATRNLTKSLESAVWIRF
ncbi:band 4.1-like protein 4B [Rhopilema esculentum]|uniref:band 4.1-like protein 4B n=1 Tax=Rhopilema esculentum TaxID=499914 RepID=UPI0031D63B7C